MKTKKYLSLIITCLVISECYGCYKPSDNINSYAENKSEGKNTSEIETIKNTDYNDDDLNINWGYGCKLDGIVYILNNDRLKYYEDGKMKNICRDPLCKHMDMTCPSNTIVSMRLIATDGQNLYCLGYHFDKNPEYQRDIEAGRTPDKDEYIIYDCIYEMNPHTQKLKVVTKWETTGITIPLLRVYKDYIYFLKVKSESDINLYKVNKNGGDSIITNEKESISDINFFENKIIYRKNNSYYVADSDFKGSKLFIDELLAFFTFKDNYIYYATGSQKSYNCSNSDKKITLFSSDIYRIKTENASDLKKAELLIKDALLPDNFAVTDNKIIYLPIDPVYKGQITLEGVDGKVDLYNYSNGKVMTLDLKTLEKKTVCTEMIDGNSAINYADDNQALSHNSEKQKTYRLDISTGKLTELKEEK